MRYYKVTESANYCGYDDEYLVKSERDLDGVDDYACMEADERSVSEAFEVEEDEEELHISCDVVEISEEDFNRLQKEEWLGVREVN